jgi:hypothetical protein
MTLDEWNAILRPGEPPAKIPDRPVWNSPLKRFWVGDPAGPEHPTARGARELAFKLKHQPKFW